MFDPTKNDHAATVFGPRIEFDLSLSSTHVLNAILKKNYQNYDRLRDVCAMEDNRTSAAPTVEVNDHPVYYRDDQPEQRDEQQAHTAGLDFQVQFDKDDDNFHCPVCWYDRMTMEYHESHKLMSCAKRRLVKFLPLLSRASKRLR
ncbi:hypothetical protein Bca4012_021721 [Brassica carinata]